MSSIVIWEADPPDPSRITIGMSELLSELSAHAKGHLLRQAGLVIEANGTNGTAWAEVKLVVDVWSQSELDARVEAVSRKLAERDGWMPDMLVHKALGSAPIIDGLRYLIPAGDLFPVWEIYAERVRDTMELEQELK